MYVLFVAQKKKNSQKLNKGGIKKMTNVKNVGEKLFCKLCGNEIEITKVGGGELICCGQSMELIQ